MEAVSAMESVVDALPLPEPERARIKVLLTGEPVQDGALIAQALAGGLKPDEAALLDELPARQPGGQEGHQGN